MAYLKRFEMFRIEVFDDGVFHCDELGLKSELLRTLEQRIAETIESQKAKRNIFYFDDKEQAMKRGVFLTTDCAHEQWCIKDSDTGINRTVDPYCVYTANQANLELVQRHAILKNDISFAQAAMQKVLEDIGNAERYSPN